MINFKDISYLKKGTEKQQQAYAVLFKNKILEKLKYYNAILVGTIPINIDIENSDLDIICYVKDQEKFKEEIVSLFGKEQDFLFKENKTFNTLLASFKIENFEIELFAQDLPTEQQNAYLHMLIEHELLLEKGETFRKEIVALKNKGDKTEPAFAKLLGLTGNPYEALLKLKH